MCTHSQFNVDVCLHHQLKRHRPPTHFMQMASQDSQLLALYIHHYSALVVFSSQDFSERTIEVRGSCEAIDPFQAANSRTKACLGTGSLDPWTLCTYCRPPSVCNAPEVAFTTQHLTGFDTSPRRRRWHPIPGHATAFRCSAGCAPKQARPLHEVCLWPLLSDRCCLAKVGFEFA